MLTKEQLINELITNKLSIKDLAIKLSVPRSKITYLVKKYKLSEALSEIRFDNRSLINKEFDRLTVKKFAGTDTWGKSEWECECKCGKIVTVGITRLNTKVTRSCGCLKQDTNNARLWKGCGEISLDTFSSIKRSAMSRNLQFDITIEYLWQLFQKQDSKCALSGVVISLHKHKRNGIRATASLDRIDNNLGYIEGNVQWVHKHINICKHTYSNQEFIQMCNNVATLHPITYPHL